ncbi:MAG: BamA/TamA family outer membrane protein [bacterium]
MPSIRRLGRLALALVAGAFAAPPISAQLPAHPGAPRLEVRQVSVTGVSKAVNIAELRRSIYTEPTSCQSAILTLVCRFGRFSSFEQKHYLDRKEFQKDVLRIRVFYYRAGFREAQVDTTVTKTDEDEVTVHFDVHEGPPTIVTDVAVAYDTTMFSSRRIRQLTVLKTGKPLDTSTLDSMRTLFQNELWEQGYADALVDTSTVVDPAAHTARVQLRLAPSHVTTVGSITIAGNEQITPQTVLNALGFRPGDLYRRSAVLESQRNLYESNLFKLAVLEVPQTFDSAKSVSVLLREAPLHEARTSVGFNTVDFVQTEGRFTHYNLFGGARRLDVSLTAGNLFATQLNHNSLFITQTPDSSITGDPADFLAPTWQTSATLTQPSFLQGSRNSLSFGVFAQRRAVPAVVIDRGYGGDLTYTRTTSFRAPISLSYRFEVTRVEAGGPYFCVNFGVCDTTTVGALRSHQRLSPLSLQYHVDRSDQPLDPTSGYTVQAQLEHASALTISDYRYNRLYAEGTSYNRLGVRGGVLAMHLKVGFVRPLQGGGTLDDAVLHPRKRFYAGGSQSVRGYGENQLGPRILTLPPAFLAFSHTATGAPCDVTTSAIAKCDPNFITDTTNANLAAGDDKFTPRPTGGTSLLEGSVEYRFPLPILSNLAAAVFLDGAAVGERILNPLQGVQTLADLVHGTWAITPGFGVRYLSSVGPIRIDLGYNPARAEDLPVVTELVRNGKRELIALEIPRRYAPLAAGGGFRSALDRFTLHLSIGQAF